MWRNNACPQFYLQQEGALCAQHCLNALLQEEYFDPSSLAELAKELDEQERQHMSAGSNVNSPSANMDDTGFFSVQVISKALQVWGLDLLSFDSSEERALRARQQPMDEHAFICNYNEHWFTIRKIGNQWFNLNSLLTGPELITDTHLSLVLAQLQGEGYTIYIVTGDLPECSADDILRITPAFQAEPPQLLDSQQRTQTRTDRGASSSSTSYAYDDDLELQRAMQMSLEESRRHQGGAGASSASADARQFSSEELDLALQLSQSLESRPKFDSDQSKVASEEDELQMAIAMSLEQPKPKEQASKETKEAVRKPAPGAATASTKPQAAVKPAVAGPSKKKEPAKPAPTTSTLNSRIPSTRPRDQAVNINVNQTPGDGIRLGGDLNPGRLSTPDPEEVRRRRLAFLDKFDKKGKEADNNE